MVFKSLICYALEVPSGHADKFMSPLPSHPPTHSPKVPSGKRTRAVTSIPRACKKKKKKKKRIGGGGELAFISAFPNQQRWCCKKKMEARSERALRTRFFFFFFFPAFCARLARPVGARQRKFPFPELGRKPVKSAFVVGWAVLIV